MDHERPNFLHLGPEKTGTSWLYAMLAQHPDVHVNPVKEVRYLWEASAFPTEGLIGRFGHGDWHNRDYRAYLRERVRFYLRHPRAAVTSVERLKWDCRYLFGRRSDAWFERLFRCSATHISGDFSPQTSHLPPWDILRIARAWPDVEVMLTLREPVEWAWSAARMSLIGDRDPAAIGDSEFHDFFIEYASYFPSASMIATWQRFFAGRFHLMWFDDIVADPDRVLSDVCHFLGLATAPVSGFEAVAQASNPGRKLALPARFRALLIELYRDEVELLAMRYSGHPRQWLERYRDTG
ncbi:MAG: sulfotransferase [Sphingomicrobium sp.]